MAIDPRRIKDLFVAALEQPDFAARQAFLDRECAGDAELRQQLDALLHAHEAPASALERPLVEISPATPEATATSDESPSAAGEIIGPYKLIEPIGEGGMGTVWMAQQTEPVKRLVALKLIKAGMDSKQVIARFEAERQALAIMDHPNIAKVFDGGMTGLEAEAQRGGTYDAPRCASASFGRPYFVMELVKGVPITKYCDEHHLTPRQRLELFIPVCHAVQHAHQKGIIHRDLKPSNVLVALYDGKPVPKVIDFGVAKAAGQPLTEQTLVTGFGALVGTPEYMSPEQAEVNQLDIDTRSDIYSLGVLLYELLAGSPPFSRKELEKAGMLEMLRVIREQEPSKPSTKLSTAEGLPTLAANRGTEPAKLTKLVRGELDWIVMKALEKDRNRRYETANGFAMDVQRYLADEAVHACPPSVGYRFRKFARRNKAAIGVAALVLVFVVLLGGVVGWAWRDRAAREQEIALDRSKKLALTEEGIRQALDRGSKSRAELHAILKKPGGVQELLNQPARWELFIKTAQGELAQARQLANRAEGSLDPEWTQAMDKLDRQLASDQADFDLAQRLETVRLDRATLAKGGFGYHKAADEYSNAFAGFAVRGDDPAAVAARLGSSPIKEQLVAGLDDWAWVAFRLGDKVLPEQVLAVARQAAPDPAWGDRLRQVTVWGDPEALGKLVAQAPAAGLSPQLLDLVGLLLDLVDSPLREPWRRRAQAEHPADFWLNYNLANVLSEANPGEAAGFSRVAVAVRPGNIAAYCTLGSDLLNQKDQKKVDEAIACFQKAIEINPRYARAHNNLGLALCEQKKLDEAIVAIRKAIEVDPKYAPAHNGLGATLYHQQKVDEAIAAYREAINLNPDYASAHNNLGLALRKQGKQDEAIDAFRSAVALDRKYADAHKNLGLALMEKAWSLANHPDPKDRDFKRALELSKNAVELTRESAMVRQYLGWVQYRAGNWKASIKALEKSCDLERGGDCGQWIVMSLAHWKLANEKGDPVDQARHRAEARRWYERAVNQVDGWKGRPNDSVGGAIWDFRAEALKLIGPDPEKK